MPDLVTIIKALADENRLRAVCALRGRELCVCQITELLGLAPSTVSKHMAILKQARLVEGRKNGRWMHYRLSGNDTPTEARQVLRSICGTLSKDCQIQQDERRLKEILKISPEEICKRQREK